MRASACLLAASLFLLASPSLGRAEIVTFNFTGQTFNSLGGSSALAQAVSGQAESPFSGSFSYDASPYTTVTRDYSSSVVAGSLILNVGGESIQSTPGQPIGLYYNHHGVFAIDGALSGVLPSKPFGATPKYSYFELYLSPYGLSELAPPTEFPGDPITGFDTGAAGLQFSFDDGNLNHEPFLIGQADLYQITASAPVHNTPEPSGLLLGGIGATLWAWGYRRSRRVKTLPSPA